MTNPFYRYAVVVGGLLLICSTAHGIGPARLVRDIAVAPDPAAESNPGGFLALDEFVYFSADDGRHGVELWRTDGTTSGTRLVLDLNPGVDSSHPYLIGPMGESILFVAMDSLHGSELWLTDGTAGGTRLIKDIDPGPNSSGAQLFGQTRTGRIVFAASEPTMGRELWASDGTEAGTVLLKEFNPGPFAATFLEGTSAGGYVYFVVRVGASPQQLWRTDGTPDGTIALLTPELGVATGASASALVALHDILLFSAFDGESSTMWRSAGTSATTYPIGARIKAPVDSIVVGNRLYYLTANWELWWTDGTAAGTVFVRSFERAGGSGKLAALGDIVYFAATTLDLGTELWRSDGTQAGTRVVADIRTGRNSGLFPALEFNLVALDDHLYFAAQADDGLELWRSDGTAAGTSQVRDISPSANTGSAPRLGAILNGTILFSATDYVHGRELWRSDGSEAGTTLLADIKVKNRGSVNDILAAAPSGVYFFAGDGTADRAELWYSDGSEIGTHPIKVIRDGLPASLPLAKGKVVGNVLFFGVDDGVHGNELWRSDGTEHGTFLVRDLLEGQASSQPRDFAELAGMVLFIAGDERQRGRLWRSDGTAAGTQPLTSAEQGDVFALTGAFCDHLLLQVQPPSRAQYVPWLSDGTAAGTRSLQGDIADPIEYAYLVAPLGEGLVLDATTEAQGDEIWFTNWTAAGTRLIREIVPGPSRTTIGGLAAVEGWVVFSAPDASSWRQLWSTDGTEKGTVTLTDFAGPSAWLFLTPTAGDAYFIRQSSTSSELWSSDGSVANTRLVKSLPVRPETEQSFSWFAAVGTSLVFTMDTDGFGNELWYSDGTPSGTSMVTDIAPGALSSDPRSLSVAGDQLFLIADDQRHGRELWVVPVADRTPTPTPTKTSTPTRVPTVSATATTTATATMSNTPSPTPSHSSGSSSGCALGAPASRGLGVWAVALITFASICGPRWR